jgi:hypothetical protein
MSARVSRSVTADNWRFHRFRLTHNARSADDCAARYGMIEDCHEPARHRRAASYPSRRDWRAIRLLAPAGGTAKSVADNYPLMRGTLVTVGEHELLLYTQGDASAVTGGQRYFPEGRGLPRPLLLRRYAGHADAALVGAEVLALSKMDWNNDKLYDTLPATQAFAKDLADVVKRIPSLDPRPYALRLFM